MLLRVQFLVGSRGKFIHGHQLTAGDAGELGLPWLTHIDETDAGLRLGMLIEELLGLLYRDFKGKHIPSIREEVGPATDAEAID